MTQKNYQTLRKVGPFWAEWAFTRTKKNHFLTKSTQPRLNCSERVYGSLIFENRQIWDSEFGQNSSIRTVGNINKRPSPILIQQKRGQFSAFLPFKHPSSVIWSLKINIFWILTKFLNKNCWNYQQTAQYYTTTTKKRAIFCLPSLQACI